MSYVRQVPKFLQAHAHLLGKGAVASLAGPEGATLVQDVDSDKEDDIEHDDGVRHISCQRRQEPAVPALTCSICRLMRRAKQATLLHAGRITASCC